MTNINSRNKILTIIMVYITKCHGSQRSENIKSINAQYFRKLKKSNDKSNDPMK